MGSSTKESDPKFFIKTAAAAAFDMFAAEADGLRELAATKTIRVPEVIEVTVAGGEARIVLERIEFEKTTREIEGLLGEQLAAVHRCTAENFGWHRDNTIGLTPQRNIQTDDWVSFFREQRLEFQLQLAASNGYGGELSALGEELVVKLPEIFDKHDPVPSLLHGDLWGGNWGAADGQPIIFDPAVYYGDRETDIAMTKLFGGFGPAFYEAYEAAWPLTEGFETRCRLYQLYHVLNHLNLFGHAYRGQAISLMRSLLLTSGCGRGDVRPK
jgi:fructosamine-3-kinase